MAKKQDLLQLFISLAAIAAFFLGVGGLLMHARLGQLVGQPIGQPIFISPYFSIVVMACGLALFAARTYPRYSRFWAIIVILVIVPARLAHLLYEPWINGREISANFITALILVAAVASLVYFHIFRPPRHLASRKDFAIAVLGVALSILTSFALIEENIVTRQHVAASSADAITSNLIRHTDEGPSLIIRMGERFSTLDPMPSEKFFHSEFRRYLRDFPFITGLLLVDNENRVVHQVSDHSRLTGIESATDHPALRDLLRQARDNAQPRAAVLDMACCNPKTEVVIAPLFGPAMGGWSIVALIDIVDIVRWAMDQTGHGGYFRIAHHGSVLYQSSDAIPPSPVAAGTIDIADHRNTGLQFSYLYTSSDITLGTEVWADFVWLAGIFFTLLLISSRRMTELARKHAVQLSYNALHDPLTGLPNRRILEQALRNACGQAKRRGQSVSVVFFDVEGIKLINDSIGHDIGDDVLIEVARRLTQNSLEDSTVTQLSGIEFVLVLVGLSLPQVQEYTGKVINALSRPYNIDGRILTMATHAGIALSDGQVDDPMELVRRADMAMLDAKKEGQNTWRTYTDDLSTHVIERIALRDDLQTALDTGSLELYYQPIMEGHSGRVIGLEALTRWLHDTRGYISPERFISLAEETGQIMALTTWSLYTACRDSVRLREHGLPDFPVIVNISPLYFQRSDFVENVQKALHDTGLPARFLELEITESLLLDNEKPAILTLNRLQEMGIRVSIDDFGTGYSSLSYLKKLPIDKIKIDRSFITDLVNDPADAAITQAIISMAHHLNIRVVAEGVETVAQLAFLRRRNCDAFQGYLFARPMPFDQLVPLLLKSQGHLFPAKSAARQTSA